MTDNRMLMHGDPPEYWVPLSEYKSLTARLAAAEKREQELRVELAIEKAFHSDMELYYHLLHKRDEAAKGGRDDQA